MCVSYSLLDLICNEWFVLYERPQQVIDAMIKCSENVIKHGQGTLPFTAPDHIVKEHYLNAKKAFKVKLKYICPLEDRSGKSVAVLTTLRAEVISEGTDVSKIHMI